MLWTAKVGTHNGSVDEFIFDGSQPTVEEVLDRANLSAEGMSVKIDGEPAREGLETLVPNGGVVYLHPKTDGGR